MQGFITGAVGGTVSAHAKMQRLPRGNQSRRSNPIVGTVTHHREIEVPRTRELAECPVGVDLLMLTARRGSVGALPRLSGVAEV